MTFLNLVQKREWDGGEGMVHCSMFIHIIKLNSKEKRIVHCTISTNLTFNPPGFLFKLDF